MSAAPVGYTREDMARPPEKFMRAEPVYEGAADDEYLMGVLEELAAREGWAEAVERAGGIPTETPPEVTREANPHYGRPGPDGEPDPVKLFIVSRGWAIRRA